ncbi:MAG: extracellular solute-binding protein [Halorientalis sp.]
MGADPPLGRRAVLSGLVSLAGGVAGCARTVGTREGATPVSILAAGSLNDALEHGLKSSVTPRLQVEVRGSAAVARLVAEGQKDPNIVSVADVALFKSPLEPAWFAEFATNSVVLAYNADTEGGKRVADAGTETWYRPLVAGDVALGRTDPDLDPLGYRTLFVLELATDYYETDRDLRAAIPARNQIYPEAQLISQFETGAIDAAFAYRSMAVERGYEYVELPAAIDLSDPTATDHYADASYELPSGTVVRGGLISYGSTIRHRSRPVVDVFETQVTGAYLTDFGFVVPEGYPRFTGHVPETIAN